MWILADSLAFAAKKKLRIAELRYLTLSTASFEEARRQNVSKHSAAGALRVELKKN
ncbi:hypothetical protein QT971_29260 [Microcoleus sp. herbarium19]|uniref:hypothetical protein n=1 Tax=Microcoleus sp. herbarium13 TaxID=3055438 RepID=UPI002FD362CD